MRNSVALVLDENFGSRLCSLAVQMPVWIVSSKANDTAVQAVRVTCGDGRITAMSAKPGEDLEYLLMRALYAIDEHHGEMSQVVPYDMLVVYGTSIEPPYELQVELGFKSIEPTDGGYVITK